MSHDVERFSKWAPTYDRHYLQRLVFEPLQQAVLELAEREVPKPRRILDIGCGTGRLLKSAAERFPEAKLDGVDAAEGMIQQANATNNSERITFVQATAEKLPFPADQFDLVFTTMTFHHWADQRQGVAEIARVLSDGGRWILADVVVGGFFAFMRRLFRLKFPQRAELEAQLSGHRLRVVDERRVRRRISVLVIGRIA